MPDQRKPKGNPRRAKGKGDYEIALGPAAGKAKVLVGPFVNKLLDEATIGMEAAQSNAIVNERFFHGRQERTGGLSMADTSQGADVYRNYLRNLVQTWNARFLEDRPSRTAYPVNAHPKDVAAAQAANIYLDHQSRVMGEDAMAWELALYCQLHGSVGLKVVWDPSYGNPVLSPVIDETTGLPETDEEGNIAYESLGPEGGVVWKIQTIFDFAYGGSDRIEDADYVVFVNYIDEYHAKQVLLDSGVGEANAQVKPEGYTTPWGQKAQGVRTLEFWHRPGPRIPNGLYARVIGGMTADCRWYPLDHGMLPVSVWHLNKVRGHAYGTSHVDDAVPVQRFINEQEAAKVETVRKTGVPRLLAISSISENVEAGPHILDCDTYNDVSQGARYLEPPKANDLVFGTQQEQISAMYNVFGLNEVNTGKDSVKSGTSAKQIAYLNRLDAQKQSGAMKGYEAFWKRVCQIDLATVRQYAESERLFRMIGEDGSLKIASLRGADLTGGTDIHIEPASGIEKFHAAAAQEAQEDLQMGKISPQAASERAETGLGQTMGQSHLNELASKVAEAAARNQPVQVPPELQQAPQAILKAVSTARGIYGDVPALVQLGQKAQQAMQQLQAKAQAQAQAQPQGAKPPPPGAKR